MPRVPTYDDFQATPTTGPAERFVDNIDPNKLSTGAKQLEDLGNAETQLGNTETGINVDKADLANQLRVEDAMNQARAHAQQLAYDPQEGYLTLKGAQALQRPGGVALDDEYGQKLQLGISDINRKLGNPAQQRMFALRSGELTTTFKGDVERHMMDQFQDYRVSVAQGAKELSTQDAQANWNDPVKLHKAVNGIKQSIYEEGIATGISANEIQAKQNLAESGVYAKAIETGLSSNNPTYAMGLFNQYKGRMTGDDILRTQGMINPHMDNQMALNATKATTVKYAAAFMPSDMDRLNGLVLGKESRGQDYNPDGTPVVNPKTGARYAMQVMPATAINPGYGIKPAQSDTPAEYNRVGREYLPAMLKQYGALDKALAAYNDGPGNLDDAMAAAKKDGKPDQWLSFMPPETQDYVDKITRRFYAGVGAPPLPTKSEFVSDAIDRLGDTPRPESVAATRETAEKQFDMLQASRKEQGENALATAQKELIANGGDFTGLQPDTRANLSRFDADKYDDALKFANRISKGENLTNMGAFAAAVTHPDELAKMSDATFQQYLTMNFSSYDQEKIAKLRANELSGKTDDSAESINNAALNAALNNRLTNMGINTSPKKTDMKALERVGTIQKFIRDDIFEQQKQLGRKMAPKEIENRVDDLFSKSLEFAREILPGNIILPMLGMEFEDLPYSVREQIKAKFAQHGITNPTDGDVMRAYWKNKNARW